MYRGLLKDRRYKVKVSHSLLAMGVVCGWGVVGKRPSYLGHNIQKSFIDLKDVPIYCQVDSENFQIGKWPSPGSSSQCFGNFLHGNHVVKPLHHGISQLRLHDWRDKQNSCSWLYQYSSLLL